MSVRRALAALLALAVAGVLAATAFAATHTVKVGDNYFLHKHGRHSLTVSRGTKVRFVWRGHHMHDVHVVKGPRRFHSAIKRSGSFSRRLTHRGTYKLICDVHPSTMHLTIHVR